MRAVALVPAAGGGSRLASALPKPLVPLCGRPLLLHTLTRLERVAAIEGIVVVAAVDLRATIEREVVARGGLARVLAVVPGGAERQHSVRAGLEAVPAWADLVVVHDGARPLVPPALVERVLEAAARAGAALAAVRPIDTVRADGEGTLDRRTLWLVQTPQAFAASLLREAHARAAAEGVAASDDAALVERLGRTPAVVPGSRRNLKVTTREDLVVAEALLVEEAREEGTAG